MRARVTGQNPGEPGKVRQNDYLIASPDLRVDALSPIATVMIHAKHPAFHPVFAMARLPLDRGEISGSERSVDPLNVIQLPSGTERSLLKSEVDDDGLLFTLRRHSLISYLPLLGGSPPGGRSGSPMMGMLPKHARVSDGRPSSQGTSNFCTLSYKGNCHGHSKGQVSVPFPTPMLSSAERRLWTFTRLCTHNKQVRNWLHCQL